MFALRAPVAARALVGLILASVAVLGMRDDVVARARPLVVTSATFRDGGTLPVSAALDRCGGANRSPELSWHGAPAETKGYVVVLHDPDARAVGGFFHWLLFDVPASVTSLAANAGVTGTPAGSVAGTNDMGVEHYGGPCPPSGDPQHHYVFTIFAVNVAHLAGAGSRTTGASLRLLLRGHVLAKGEIVGRFGR